MNQLLHPGWWFSFFSQWAVWWLFCVVVSCAALPLTMRMFRGLADRGAGLAFGVGLIVMTFLSWVLGLEWLTAGKAFLFVRFVFIGLGLAFLTLGALCNARGYVRGKGALTVYTPGIACIFLGLVHLPHGLLSVAAAVILLVLASAACWLHAPERFFRSLRVALIPFLLTQILFLVAFAFFVNVRSYIPWATFEISLFQAEKWGNYSHLQSVMRTDALPPRDVWFNGEPTNYYYGGHILTATIAKATGTPLRLAFNFGLATLFALTITVGFSFILSLVHLTTRKVRLLRGLTWHSGIAWALFGTLAIGMFGNLDPLRQLFTREVDHGVRTRWEREQRNAQEEWKMRSGVPAGIALSAYSTLSQGADANKLEVLRAELRRLAAQQGERQSSADEYVESVRRRVQVALADENLTARERADQVRQNMLSDSDLSFYRGLSNVNAIELEERLLRRILLGEYEEALKDLEESTKGAEGYAPRLEQLAEELDEQIEAALNSPAIEKLYEELADPEKAGIVESLLGLSGDAASSELAQTRRDRAYGRTASLLQGWLEADRVRRPSKEQRELLERIRSARDAFGIDGVAFLDRNWGGAPPTFTTNPTIQDLRFTWHNISFLDFWAPSRTIKSSLPGENFSGTITEFPYFSAILGDHHPHHFAIPFTLAALCACVSLLRKNSRRTSGDLTYFMRSWPDILTMAFFIGTVFAVNIWDSIVLAPIYALAVLISRRGVTTGSGWGWVGFGGFIVLLTIIVSLLHNSIPDVAPLFQTFLFWILAAGLMMVSLPALLFLMPYASRWKISLCAFAAAVACIAIGAAIAPGAGGTEERKVLSIVLRDVFVFAMIVAFAALWALRHPSPTARWWYAAGATYALVGGASFLFVIPFQAFFASPLVPEGKLLYDMAPPVLSHSLVTAPKFWTEFWRSVPINPFDGRLRTEMRDFMAHWGLFFVPIVVLLVSRIFKANRERDTGFHFMIMGIAVAAAALGRVYLGYWPGALSLAFIVLCLRNAIEFRRRAEGPVWVLLAGAFFWTWFAEGLHFDDDMAGSYERYNSVFKIYYPIWIIMAGGMVVAVREIFARFPLPKAPPAHLLLNGGFWAAVLILGVITPVVLNQFLSPSLVQVWFFLFWIPTAIVIIACAVQAMQNTTFLPGEIASAAASRAMANWPAFLVAVFILCIGMYYPIGATATRTREFFTWPMSGSGEAQTPHRNIYMTRTLDGLDHYIHYPQYRQDFKAVAWMEENLPRTATVLEHAGNHAYSHSGRMSAGSGLATTINWMHHENQWRGRARPAYPRMKEAMMERLSRLPNAVPDMDAAFRRVLPDLVDPVTPEQQHRLRMAGSSERMRLLREMVPTATQMELYRLRDAVERHDVSMMTVMNLILNDSLDIYRSDDERRTRRLFEIYGIDYVVVGELERSQFGQNVVTKFRDWGFEEIYNSSASEHLLPDEKSVDKPTIILKVPADFPLPPEVTE